jgi:ATP-dependent Clp protease ATP-binding subunit ClpB
MELAQESKHIELTPLHLAFVLFNENGGLAQRICTKSNVDCKSVLSDLKTGLSKLSVQDPPPNDIGPNSAFLKLLRTANGKWRGRVRCGVVEAAAIQVEGGT